MKANAIVIATLLLHGCATAVMVGAGQSGRMADGRSYEEARPDNRITAEVNRRLVTDPQVRGVAIDVYTEDGVVYLYGRGISPVQAERAAALARAVPGVARVERRFK